ncbi:MAG: MBL fold metallo-hydrolase [Campylobacteraceae bacterium]|jgi:glyoxylase-like metal-dependent hydrolase (beta-lactamase superfamily II)|nr:MBL fold metallo-hydrolase [Campylobacteraceae bacterium]
MLKIVSKPMGFLETNCYIIYLPKGEIIVDPGMEADEWVIQNIQNPLAILNTHGHFDHVWSNYALQTKLKTFLYTPKLDVFMLQNDPFGYGMPSSKPDFEVDGDEKFEIGGIEVDFIHFPGHTPGCSAIKIEDALFSGDFIFKNSIGRTDFPYSSPEDMKKSIMKFLKIEEDLKVYPGHGANTSVKAEQKNLPSWLEYI